MATKVVDRESQSQTEQWFNPVVTCALTHALSVVGQLLINPGGILVLPDLFWGNYRLIFEQALGVKIVTFDDFQRRGFQCARLSRMPCVASREAVTLLLNFPNNPTGYNLARSEATQLRDGLTKVAEERRGLGVIVDDAYFGLNYEDGLLEESIFSMLADAHEALLAVKVDGATKEDYVWGFRGVPYPSAIVVRHRLPSRHWRTSVRDWSEGQSRMPQEFHKRFC